MGVRFSIEKPLWSLDIFIAASRHLTVGQPFKAGLGNLNQYPVAERQMRWQTPTGCEIQAPLTRRGFPMGHRGTGLERPAYRQAPRCGGATGVSVPSISHLSTKRVFHSGKYVTAGISIRVVVWRRPIMSKLTPAREQFQ
ncbi:MAG: hypothetical protein DMG05_11975 [Acidobacteria bacterium]|nr:MAG: hypothetical protein DMG05_11975 [Acidobacteriota bacterium]